MMTLAEKHISLEMNFLSQTVEQIGFLRKRNRNRIQSSTPLLEPVAYLYMFVTWPRHMKQSKVLLMIENSSGAVAFVNSHQRSTNVLHVIGHRPHCEALFLF